MIYRPCGIGFIAVLLAAACSAEELSFDSAPLRLLPPDLTAAESLALPCWFGEPESLESPPPAAPAGPQDRLSRIDPLRLNDEPGIPPAVNGSGPLRAFGLFDVQGYVWEQREDVFGRAWRWGGTGDDTFDPRWQRANGWNDDPDLWQSTGPGVPGPGSPGGFGEQRSTGVHLMLTLPGSSK